MEFSAYLMFNGACEAAMNFYKNALGAEMKMMQRYGDAPPMPGGDGEGWKDKILHCGIEKDGFIIMGSDTNKPDNRIVDGNNVQLSVNLHSREETEQVFNAISAGGSITMPLQDTFWGAYFGMCVDQFGVSWMFNYDAPKQ